jgi:hypothetical protein
VYALGLNVVEPTGQDCYAPCVDSTFNVFLKQGTKLVGVVSFNAPNDVLAFFGVWSETPFTQVEIRETFKSIDNEYFGEVFTGTTPAPTKLVMARFDAKGTGSASETTPQETTDITLKFTPGSGLNPLGEALRLQLLPSLELQDRPDPCFDVFIPPNCFSFDPSTGRYTVAALGCGVQVALINEATSYFKDLTPLVQSFSAELKEETGAWQARLALTLAEPVADPAPCGITFTVGNDGVENVPLDSSVRFEDTKAGTVSVKGTLSSSQTTQTASTDVSLTFPVANPGFNPPAVTTRLELRPASIPKTPSRVSTCSSRRAAMSRPRGALPCPVLAVACRWR